LSHIIAIENRPMVTVKIALQVAMSKNSNWQKKCFTKRNNELTGSYLSLNYNLVSAFYNFKHFWEGILNWIYTKTIGMKPNKGKCLKCFYR